LKVKEISANCNRKIRLGVGAEILLGGSVTLEFEDSDSVASLPPSVAFEQLLTKVITTVNRLADKIEDNVETPANWPGATTITQEKANTL
jgi:hypothetical protein